MFSRRHLRPADAPPLLHVWELPREARCAGEALCTEQDASAIIVYHVRAVASSDGGFICLTCGMTGKDGVAR